MTSYYPFYSSPQSAKETQEDDMQVVSSMKIDEGIDTKKKNQTFSLLHSAFNDQDSKCVWNDPYEPAAAAAGNNCRFGTFLNPLSFPHLPPAFSTRHPLSFAPLIFCIIRLSLASIRGRRQLTSSFRGGRGVGAAEETRGEAARL